MFRTIERYEATSMGVPFSLILINGAEEEIDDETGHAVGIHIPNLEGLIAAVTVARVLIPLQLSGAEVKFIRRALGKSSKDFAESLALDPASLSRWENGKQILGGWADKQVRMAAVILLGDKVPSLNIDQKSIVDLQMHPRSEGDNLTMTMQLIHSHQENCGSTDDADGWTMQAAA